MIELSQMKPLATQCSNTSSHSDTEVNQNWARPVPGRETVLGAPGAAVMGSDTDATQWQVDSVNLGPPTGGGKARKSPK